MRIGLHRVTSTRLRQILDEAQVEGTATILVTLKLGNGRLRCLGAVEADHTRASGSAAGLILNLGLLDFTNGGEEINQVVIARRPGKLRLVSYQDARAGYEETTHISDEDDFAPLCSRRGIVREGVGRNRGSRGVEAATGTTRTARAARASRTRTSTEASSAAETEAAAATAKASTAEAAAAEATSHATTIATTETHPGAIVSIAVLTDFKHATVPVIAIKLLNGIARVVGALEDDDS